MNKSFDKVAGVFFLLISILYIMESLKISDSAYGSAVGPKTFPFILGVILGLLSLRLLYEAFKMKAQNEGKETFNYKRFGIILISAIGYVFLLELIGYVVATFLFLFISFQSMERGKMLHSFIVAAVFSFAVYLLYVKLLGGTLPKFGLF